MKTIKNVKNAAVAEKKELWLKHFQEDLITEKNKVSDVKKTEIMCMVY